MSHAGDNPLSFSEEPNDSALDQRNRIKSLSTKKEIDPEYQKIQEDAERKRVELDGLRKFYSLRSLWSWSIIIWISAFILFHIGLTIAVGLEKLNFSNHQWLVPTIIIENFLQVIGMGYIIIKFLYPNTK